jgi:hypothetical protein
MIKSTDSKNRRHPRLGFFLLRDKLHTQPQAVKVVMAASTAFAQAVALLKTVNWPVLRMRLSQGVGMVRFLFLRCELNSVGMAVELPSLDSRQGATVQLSPQLAAITTGRRRRYHGVR